MTRRFLPSLALAAALLPGLAHSTASNKELEARANEMDARLATVERSTQQLVQLQQQIEAARQQLRELRGQIEQLQHQLETARQQQRDLYTDLDRRLLLLEHNGAPAGAGVTPGAAGVAGVAGAAGAAGAAGSGVPGTAATPEEIVAADETTVYGDAFAALKAGRYDEAIRGFSLYLTKYPQGPRADLANYWLGEAYFVKKDYNAALRQFQDLLQKFPDSRRTADAMLKVGFCQYELKAFRNARATLTKVSTGYPGTDAARQAEARLAQMDVDGR
jgi:tol-pal system protein YbgF